MEFSSSISPSGLKRKNFNETNVTVDKLIFDGKKVKGVEYVNEKGKNIVLSRQSKKSFFLQEH